MSHRGESIGRTLPPAAAQAGNAAELGAVVSSLIATLVPHDGYMLVGLDPVTGVVCFRAAEHGYSLAAARRLSADDTLDPDTFDGLAERPNPVTDHELTCGVAWHAISISRQSARPALSRIPTSRGWVALHAQPVDSLLGCDVALTIVPATATILLPAVVAWHGLTPREQDVVRCALNGLPTKHLVGVHGRHPPVLRLPKEGQHRQGQS